MNPPPHATHCQDCGASFVHIEHPLKPGVVMMSVCKCERSMAVNTNAPQWLQEWVDRVLEHVEVGDDGEGVHYIVKEGEEEGTLEVHMWPALFFDSEGDRDFGNLHAHLLPIAALYDEGKPESVCFEAGAVACQGLVGGHKVVLLILDIPPDVYEDDEEDPN